MTANRRLYQILERKLPTAIDNPSTNNNMAPVSRMVDLGTSATATPDKSPTVETKLSSTPKIKFLKYETDDILLNNYLILEHVR